MIAEDVARSGAGLFCVACGTRNAGPKVEREVVRGLDGRVLRARAVAIVARCSCGTVERVPIRRAPAEALR